MWTDGYIAVDWGTTNRRAWRVRAGAVEAEFADDLGFTSVPPGGFPAEVATVRERLGDLPLLMAGMVGARGGWVPAPYLPCPLDLATLAASLVEVPEARAFIVPGASFVDGLRGDVMRGEETQFFGAVAAGLCGADALICHPGTHNKWALMQGGRLTRFRTVMTGEMFSILKAQSLLKSWLEVEAQPGEMFSEGVSRGLEGRALTADLFTVRARVLLGSLAEDEVASFVSGLLIGADLRTGVKGMPDGEVVVMGRGALTRLYSAALTQFGRPNHQVDGEAAFLAGTNATVEQLS
ncbi:2-dehydro-3-deoxygalactonokinase [Sphingomonas kaistensis]|uniref:2-dehydro-3-deoxygalactonokinase n=1 Tax=Sphingomonas kaistensis TaxID=298708 RepID=A0A7X5Y313_9SPHN|nr:2-dehydro-3-deoxygalactonokinase [Sphingomonas kaistensis]NJC04258.1 2-dehydro-3-deoxygalactonokinase [Sphingomonas kaistensis]